MPVNSHPGKPELMGSWAGDRITAVGDTGPKAHIWDEIKDDSDENNWSEISQAIIVEIAESCPLEKEKLWLDGFLTDDGQLVSDNEFFV